MNLRAILLALALMGTGDAFAQSIDFGAGPNNSYNREKIPVLLNPSGSNTKPTIRQSTADEVAPRVEPSAPGRAGRHVKPTRTTRTDRARAEQAKADQAKEAKRVKLQKELNDALDKKDLTRAQTANKELNALR